MGFLDEVHASRAASAKKSNNGHHISVPSDRKQNSGLLPIAIVTGAFIGALHWRRNGHKLQASNPLAGVLDFLQNLGGGGGQTGGTKKEWKNNRPGSMAAAAAAARAQGGTTSTSTQNPSGGGGGGKKKKNNKNKKNKKKR